MNGRSPQTSPQLWAANQQLLQLRAQTGKRTGHSRPKPAPVSQHQSPLAALPSHLGWESEHVTAVLRQRTAASQRETAGEGDTSWLTPPLCRKNLPDTDQVLPVAADGAVKLYPDIALGMLRQELAAPGRVWLLARYLDEMGQGNIRIDILSHHLTNKSSSLRICGKRQLRNLLRQGEGIFWTRDKTRLWLRSAAKAAYALQVLRLTGQPVAVPVQSLTRGIGTVRAYLYASFHSSRTRETPQGRQARPVARETLAGLSGVGRVSQRAYEQIAGIQRQTNYAIGERAEEEAKEKRAWTQRQALFELKDYRGRQGKKGRIYLAWQLPNSYIGQLPRRPRGRQKRINRELKDLVMKGMPGNVGEAVEVQAMEKVYYPNGKLAARAYGRNPSRNLYWQQRGAGHGRFAVWQQLGE